MMTGAPTGAPAGATRAAAGEPEPLRDRLRDTYLRLDPRSLGVGRIFLGLVLLGDLLRRVPLLRDFYSNLGLLPNHTVLWRPPATRMFSLLFAASWPDEAGVWFAIACACFVCFTIGYRTRLFHALSFVMATSLHERVLFAENWGGAAIGVLMVWTFFLPLGQRFSVDALVASLRARPDETPDDLAAGVPPLARRPTTSLAALGLLLQIALIYGLNCWHKHGSTWREGTAVHYVLWQDRIVTWLGLQVRTHAPFALTRLLTLGTLVIEGAAPLLILTPLLWRWTRFVAAVLLAALHAGIALLANLGIFSVAMCAFLPFLLTEAQWALFGRLAARGHRARTVYYDADCGVCWVLVRAMARMDVHRRLTWIANARVSGLPPDLDRAILLESLLVLDPASGRRWTRADGFAQIFAALPLGRLWSWPMRLPLVRPLANRAYDAFARNRTTVSTWLGLAACGVPAAPRPPVADPTQRPDDPSDDSGEAPIKRWVRRWLPVAREAAVVVVFVVFTAEALSSNPGLPSWLRVQRRPEWMVAATEYPNLRQGWGLFAPDAPRTERTIFVDALTRDGRHVDPFNQAFGRVWSLPVDDVPARLDYNSFVFDYAFRIPDAGAYHQAFVEWILRYPDRTGRPQDQIASFTASVVERPSPPPSALMTTAPHVREFLRWPSR